MRRAEHQHARSGEDNPLESHEGLRWQRRRRPLLPEQPDRLTFDVSGPWLQEADRSWLDDAEGGTPWV